MEPTGSLPHVSEKYISSTEDNSEIEYYVHTDPLGTSKDSINEIIKSAKDGSVTVQGNGSDETLYALPTHIPEKNKGCVR